MSEQPRKQPGVLRKLHNKELIERMHSGEALWSFDCKASWYPPRPVIKKDPKAINQLYGSSEAVRVKAEVVVKVAGDNVSEFQPKSAS